MAKKLSPAQRANQITYFLQGDLKRIQIAYIRAGAKLAQIRDEKHPKGFIPELTDAYGLMWIETQLEDEHLGPETRKQLEALRRKALAGKLTKEDVEKFKKDGTHHRDSLTAVAASLRAIRRRAAALRDFPPALLGDIDALLDRLKSASGAVARAIRFANPRGMRISTIH